MAQSRRSCLVALAAVGGFGAGCSLVPGRKGDKTGASYRWQTELDTPYRYAARTPDLLVLAGDSRDGGGDGTVQAFDSETGSVRWSSSLQGEPSSIVGHGDVILVTEAPGRLTALLPADGATKWTYDTEEPIHVRPAFASGTVYLRSERRLHAVSGAQGEEWWTVTLPTGGSAPEAAAGNIYVGNDDHTARAYHAHGDQHWTFQAEWALSTQPTVSKDMVFVGSGDERLYALEREDGSTSWVFEATNEISAQPVVHDETLYVGSADHYVYAIDPATGSKHWKVETHSPIHSMSVDSGGTIYIQSGYGDTRASVYALAPDGTVRWQSPNNESGELLTTIVDQETLYELEWLRLSAVSLEEARRAWGRS